MALGRAASAQSPQALPVPDPGKGVTNADDTSATALNPANLAFLPGAEIRWNLVWMGTSSTYAPRGNSFSAGIPIGPFASALRLDLMNPPLASGVSANAAWLRWALAYGGPVASVGTTIAGSFSPDSALDHYASLTSGITLRPLPWLSASLVARDWNEPSSRTGPSLERSWVLGLGFRPFSVRTLEATWDLAYYEHRETFGGHGTLAYELPRLARVRGDFTVFPSSTDPTSREFVATAGLELDVDRAQVSAGALFGSAIGGSGGGLYVGGAYRSFREGPQLRMPARVARIRIRDTPGVRGHTRLLRRLWRLAEDPEVAGVLLELRAEPAASMPHAEELADAVRLLRERGKKVMCHLEDNGGRALYVCSQADRIAMNPAGGLRFAGIASSYYYFGGLLQKLGVRADFVRIGAHKLAAEQLTLARGSDVAEIDHQELVDEVARIYDEGVGRGRGFGADEARRRIARGPFIAPEAREAGLVDVLAFQDEVERFARDVMGGSVRITDDTASDPVVDGWGKTPKVAVVYLHGDMVDGESQFIPLVNVKLAGSYTVARALKRARDDDSVKAVVFRVETGGGSSLAADVILREAILTARKKPLLVSMGTSAASGGYYASVGAKEIYANRSTVTGSIGIFYGKADFVGLLDKLGVHFDHYRSGPRADAESLFRPFTDDERTELGHKVKQFYDLFVARVAEGRHMDAAAVDAIARGKVWTGEQASKNGLVDHIGGLREVLAEARRLGGLRADAPIAEWPEEDDSLLGFVLKQLGIHLSVKELSGSLPAAILPLAQIAAPFLVFEPNHPLALSEITEETRGSEKDGPDGEASE